MNTIAERINYALRAQNLDETAVYQSAGLKYTTWRDALLGVTSRPRALPEIAKAMGVRIEWLANGEGEMVDTPALVTDETHVLVDRVSGAHLSAGHGEVMWDFDTVERSHAFRRDWFQARRINPVRCKLWKCAGESMYPTMSDGSLVLIDMGQREPMQSKIFALITDDGLKVKRLFKESGIWILRSDNPMKHLYPDVQMDEHAAIIGRCVWHSSEL